MEVFDSNTLTLLKVSITIVLSFIDMLTYIDFQDICLKRRYNIQHDDNQLDNIQHEDTQVNDLVHD
jgi:hypothetical protein